MQTFLSPSSPSDRSVKPELRHQSMEGAAGAGSIPLYDEHVRRTGKISAP
jgi:hypothetical protein